MIVKLKGYVDEINEDSIDLDVSGIVFRIYLSTRDLNTMQKSNKKININTFEILREDGRSFFGFLNVDEKIIFEDLIKVQGVGGKVALNIISILTVEQIIETVRNNLVSNFKQVSGIGQKVSQRLVNEMRDKIEKSKYFKNFDKINIGLDQKKLDDLISCLNNLGYTQRISEEISRSLITDNKNKSLEQLIPLALKEIKNKI
tara:strand:- start:494 stop:1099 length:606 start_codon:yes stop_codon:yes gene_type:complete